MRLPDIYYTKQNVDGYYEPPGAPPPVQFYNGENITFDVYLSKDDKPISPDDWDLEVLVKSSIYTSEIKWKGVLNNGVYEKTTLGYYSIIISTDETKNWLAGSYWMDIVAHEKIGRSNDIKDNHIILSRQMFSFDYSAATVNPASIRDSIPAGTAPQSPDITLS